MIFSPLDRTAAERLTRLAYTNPFLPERVNLERQILGRDFESAPPVLHREAGFRFDVLHPNIAKLNAVTRRVVERARERLLATPSPEAAELQLYGDVCLFSLYLLIETDLDVRVGSTAAIARSSDWSDCWRRFSPEFDRLLKISGRSSIVPHTPEHAFAVFFQIARAFLHIYEHILGSSKAATQLRASVWESIFSHDLRRYSHWLYRHMDQIATLVTGPSGSGKELVAKAIGVSQYIPFDARRAVFICDHGAAFQAVNLSALPLTLIESELFGHHKGAFTGATAARIGWLEQCPQEGAVFLDEIGELDVTLQVKLLRVLQTRAFSRVGETTERKFRGKLIAATNRNLTDEMHAGRFRPDLFYRLCADQIVTPSLHEQLQEVPDDLHHYVSHVARRIFGEDSNDMDDFVAETEQWIEQNLSPHYAWPGNIRELEQCVRNLLIHRNYQPAQFHQKSQTATSLDRFLSDIKATSLSRDQLDGRYFALVLSRSANLEEAASRLGVDRRTLKRLLDQEFYDALC